MAENMMDGLLYVFTFQNIFLIFIGTVIGIIFGAIPGLSATMAVALCLPITFSMDIIPSMCLIIGLYLGGISGGLISAILLNIPGTPASLAATFDGHPMARNGMGGKAYTCLTMLNTGNEHNADPAKAAEHINNYYKSIGK